MKNISLYIPKLDDYYYEEKLESDPNTMDYNAGYNVSYYGYHYDTGCIDFPKERWEETYNKRIKENKFYAYIKDNDINEFVGAVNYQYNKNENKYSCGIVIESTYRGKGYAYDALKELERVAFEENNISELTDMIPLTRENAIKIFKKAGFIHSDKEEINIKFNKEEKAKELLITKEMYFKNKELFISETIDKEPYIKDITDDRIINLTGESGSGKSYFSNKYINDNNYIVIDTDIVFSNKESDNKESIDLRKIFKDKPKDYLFTNFDDFYKKVLDYFKDSNKTIVIDSAQYRNIKDVTILKGKLIVMRTSIKTCYERVLSRFDINNPNATKEEKENFAKKKQGMFSWYKAINIFIKNVDEFATNKEKHLDDIRNKITNKDFSLFTNNCLAGFIYHDLGLQFLSPTINLRIKPKEFIEFVSDLKYYLNQEIKEVKNIDSSIPVGIIDGDDNHNSITINFDHYSNFEEANKKWNERKARINYNNVYVIMEYYDGIHKEELISLFKKIPYKNKMILTHKDHSENYTTAIHCFNDDLNMENIGGKIFRYNGLTGKRYYEEFDYIKFLNKR